MNPLLVQRIQQSLEAELARDPRYMDPKQKRAHYAKVRRLRLSLARTKGSHTASQWEALVRRTGRHCVRCGYEHADNETVCKGYIVPIAMGGSNAIENLQPLCRSCCSGKFDEAIDWLSAWRETHRDDGPAIPEGA